jgi:protein-disulfide isomerase
VRLVKKIAVVSTLSLITCLAAAAPNQPTTKIANNVFTQEQNSAIDEQVQKYLSNNPKAVVDALVNYREQEIKRMESNAQNAVSKNAKEILGNVSAPTLGNPNGNVVLVEFLDYQCGHCKKMTTTVKGLIEQNKDLKVIIKELPILGEASTYAAKVALAANQQGKFSEVHTALLNANERLTNENIEKIARDQGVDWSLIQVALQNATIDAELDKVFNIAQQLNIMGTPAFIISDLTGKNNKYFGGAASQEALQQTINTINK